MATKAQLQERIEELERGHFHRATRHVDLEHLANTVQCALRRGAVRGLLAHEQACDQRRGGGRPPKRWRLATSEGGSAR